MEEKTVFQGKTKKENEYLIRYPQDGDAPAMCGYINELSKEKTFVRFQGEEVLLEDETKYLNGQLKKIKDKRTVQLLVFSDNRLVGISAVDLKDKTESHEGVFGISLSKDFRGEGIGKTLMRLTIGEAINNLPQLQIITLGIFGNNTLAISMYKNFGFKEYGRLPKGIFYKGKYIDHIYMYKNVKS